MKAPPHRQKGLFRLRKLAGLALAAFIPCVMPRASAAQAERSSHPNIVLILADDLGHGHVSCLNPKSKIKTPNIDRLAAEGITFTDAHSGSAVCSPTRYGLLTGRYAWRTRLVSGVLLPYDRPLIEKGRLTLPALLKQHGYHTTCIGKWHLGWQWPREGTNTPDFTQPITEGPTTRGFDFYFGTDVPNYPPYCFLENDRTVGQPSGQRTQRNLDGGPGPTLPDWKFDQILTRLAREAEHYLEERAGTKQPFFLYLALTSPHQPIAPSREFRDKSGLKVPLADFLIETDAVVGRIIETVKRLGLAKDTLFIFTADNGSAMHTGGNQLLKLGHDPNAGFRGSKASIYEGGHRVPFVARWPGRIKPETKSDETICLTDLMATCAAIVGARLPENAAEDSFSLLPALLGQTGGSPIRQAIVHQSAAGQLALRRGAWKLIAPATPAGAASAKKQSEQKKAELYNLREDPAETRDLAQAHPEIIKDLSELLETYRREGRSR